MNNFIIYSEEVSEEFVRNIAPCLGEIIRSIRFNSSVRVEIVSEEEYFARTEKYNHLLSILNPKKDIPREITSLFTGAAISPNYIFSDKGKKNKGITILLVPQGNSYLGIGATLLNFTSLLYLAKEGKIILSGESKGEEENTLDAVLESVSFLLGAIFSKALLRSKDLFYSLRIFRKMQDEIKEISSFSEGITNIPLLIVDYILSRDYLDLSLSPFNPTSLLIQAALSRIERIFLQMGIDVSFTFLGPVKVRENLSLYFICPSAYLSFPERFNPFKDPDFSSYLYK